MFFICELSKLYQLKKALLARFRCEKKLAKLPGLLESRIKNCSEAADLKIAEENLQNAKKADAENRKKRIRKATTVVGIISLIVMIAVALLLALSTVPTVLIIVGGTAVVTLVAYLIAKSAIKNGGKRSQAEIRFREEELARATEAFEAAKIRIETEIQEEIARYKNILNKLNKMIESNDVVHEDDKNYNTVCQIIWCLEHKYAYCVVGAKKWIARANHSKYVRARLDEIKLAPQDEADVESDANEGKDYSEEVPQTNEADA